jgi:hypothetical protein
MTPDNSGPRDCCCDKEYDYLVIEEYVGSYLYTGGEVDSFCGGPKEWEHTVSHYVDSKYSDVNITSQVNKQQDNIEVTFTISNGFSGQEDPCEIFRPSWLWPDGQPPKYKTCEFGASFQAKKLFPVDPFPWLRPEKKARVTVNIRHKRIGGLSFGDTLGGGASVTLTPCWDTSKAQDLFLQYPPCEKKTCTYDVPGYPQYAPEPTISFTVIKCSGDNVELNKTIDLRNSHIGVYVRCNYSSTNAYCFSSTVSTKFTISVEEVDP